MSADPSPHHLFDVTGVEVEYMIVDRHSLKVKPISDSLIEAVSGSISSEIERGAMAWSNELTLHLIEFKTNGPVGALDGLLDALAAEVRAANQALAPFSACLMPTAMHPFMDPATEMKLWPHDYDVVYAAFDRIFDCRGHGWANLQSVHINLPFADDEEFGRLHAAIRLVLPLLPALAASSPMAEGALTGWADTRLWHYRNNAHRVPSVTGHVIPERVFTRGAYEANILERIYEDLRPLDEEGILRHEWANARGAIARFDRDAIEIRLLDVQECPLADVAVVALVREVVKALVEERWMPWTEQRMVPETELASVLEATMREGDVARVSFSPLLRALGMGAADVRARDVWTHLARAVAPSGEDAAAWQRFYEVYQREGCLSLRLRAALGPSPDAARVHAVYRRLVEGLAANELFLPSAHSADHAPP